jgi:hypothetical protein
MAFTTSTALGGETPRGAVGVHSWILLEEVPSNRLGMRNKAKDTEILDSIPQASRELRSAM